MYLHRFLHSALGKIIVSILLGVGLATMFRQVCTGKQCMTFRGPILGDMDGKIYKHGEKCFSYRPTSQPCDKVREIVPMS